MAQMMPPYKGKMFESMKNQVLKNSFETNQMSQNYTPFFIALRYLKGENQVFFLSSQLLPLFHFAWCCSINYCLSVMNGFEKELKDRVLNVIPHASILD